MVMDTLVYQFQRDLVFSVLINNVPIVPSTNPLSDAGVPAISSIRTSKSFDNGLPTCDIEISHLPTWITLGMAVTVDLGYRSGAAGAPVMQRVFTGTVHSRDRKIAGGIIKCNGKSYALFRPVMVPERDVTGQSVSAAITGILNDAGVTDRSVVVAATTLNSSGDSQNADGNPSMLLPRSTATQMIQQLADLDGSRIYELNSGTLVIKPLEEIPAPTAAYSYSTLTQATAIILQGSDREDQDFLRDEVKVTGITPPADPNATGDAPTAITATADLTGVGTLIQPPLPVGSGSHLGMDYSNQLIDTQSLADSVARLLLNRYARIPRYFTFEIAGDPRIEIGMTIGVELVQMGITTAQRWFVHGVNHIIGQGDQGYKTQLQLRGGDLIGGTIDLAPQAAFTAVVEQENIGGQIVTMLMLDATTSHDADGAIASYAWSSNQPTGAIPSTVKANVQIDTTGWTGAWTVTLTVTDSLGATSTLTKTLDYSSSSTSVIVIPAMFAAINNNATATPDGGKTWNNSSGSTCISVGARAPDGKNAGHACYGYSNGVIKVTRNYAITLTTVTWSGTAPSTAINHIEWDWRNGNVVWAVTEAGQVCVSLNAGDTWSIYSDMRAITYNTGTATPAAVLNKIGLPGAGGVYIYGGTGAGQPLIAYDAVVGAKAWVHQAFTGDLLTDMPGDATLRIVDADAPGDGTTMIILAWASGGGASAVYYSTSAPGPSVAYTRAGNTFGGLKTGRCILGDASQWFAMFANRSVWYSLDKGATWTERTNVFPANTTPWHAIWFGRNQGPAPGVFVVALEDTVTPSNGYLVKTLDGFVTAPIIRPVTGTFAVTWPASAKGKKVSIGAAGASVSASEIIRASITHPLMIFDGSATWSDFGTSPSLAGSITKPSGLLRLGGGHWVFVDVPGNSGNIWHSRDDGNTWQNVYANDGTSGCYGVDVGSDGTLWAVYGSSTTANGTQATSPLRILKSTDHGESFQIQHTDGGFGTSQATTPCLQNNKVIAADKTNPNNIFVLCGSVANMPKRIYTLNGGTSWSQPTTATTDVTRGTNNQRGQLEFVNNSRLLYMRSTTTAQVYYTDDFGQNWVLSDFSTPGLQVGRIMGPYKSTWSNTQFVVAENDPSLIYISRNNGTNWSLLIAGGGGSGFLIDAIEYDPILDIVYAAAVTFLQAKEVTGAVRGAPTLADISNNITAGPNSGSANFLALPR